MFVFRSNAMRAVLVAVLLGCCAVTVTQAWNPSFNLNTALTMVCALCQQAFDELLDSSSWLGCCGDAGTDPYSRGGVLHERIGRLVVLHTLQGRPRCGHSVRQFMHPHKLLFPGFQVASIIYDRDTETRGFVGYLPSENIVLVSFEGTEDLENCTCYCPQSSVTACTSFLNRDHRPQCHPHSLPRR